MFNQPYLTYIDGNAKGSRRIDFTSRCVYIRGHHGSGKSAVIDDLYLALSHQHPRLGKLPANLLVLAPNHTAPLSAEVGFSTGEHARYAIEEGTTASATKPKGDGFVRPDYAVDSIIHADVLAFFDSSAPEMRRKIMRRFGEAVRAGLLDPPNDCTDAERAAWQGLVSRTKPSDPPEERLAAIKTFVASDKIYCGKRIAELDKKLAGVVPTARTEAEVTALWTARTAVATMVTAWEQQGQRARLEGEIAQYAGVESALAAARAEQEQLTRQMALAQGVLALVNAAGHFTSCPLCEVGPADRAMAMRDSAAAMLQRTRWAADKVQARINQLSQQLSTVGQSRRALALIPPIPADSEERCRAELQRLDERYAMIKSDADAFALYRADEVARAEKKREYETLQRLGAYVAQRIEWAVARVATKFCAKLSAYLPEGRRAGVVLHNEHRDVCDVGLVGAGGVVYPADALGGRELGDLVVAVAGAFGEGRKFSVLVLDDLILGHFREAAALSGLYERCAKLVTDGLISNVIACGTREAWVGTPGWQVVDVG